MCLLAAWSGSSSEECVICLSLLSVLVQGQVSVCVGCCTERRGTAKGRQKMQKVNKE